MDRIHVESSNIRSVGYDPNIQTLEMEFHTRTVYQYFNVPEQEYLSLMNSPSHGSYFNKYIKGRYRHQKIL